MEAEKREKLLSCIRKDDAAAFGAIVDPEAFSSVFGRFPLLSLVYLFNAKHIEKGYFSELIKERPRQKEPSFREADKMFALKGGKCLRYYTSSEVSPLEMLALLGRRRELGKLYALYPNAPRYLASLDRIFYTRIGSGVREEKGKLILPKEPLSFAVKRALVRFAVIYSVLFVMIASATSACLVYYGTGSTKNFFRAESGKSTELALKKDLYIKLGKDLSLSSSVAEYSAIFEGGGHVVRLTSPFAEKVTGEIRDVIFVLEEGFEGDAVILENSGVIKNVRVVAEGLTLSKGGEHMGLLTAVNKGAIEECTAVVNVSIEGEGGGDCFFAPFAGDNEGVIVGCTTDGVLHGKNADVGGIAGINGENGSITDCGVRTELSELSDIKNWTPNVAGVAAHNFGTVSSCAVTGTITSVLGASAPDPTDEHVPSAYAAGIVCVNGGTIINCENACLVSAEATNGYALAGGIAIANSYIDQDNKLYVGNIESSRSKGEVKSTASSIYYAYAAGIAVNNMYGGTITGCVVSEKVSAISTYAGETLEDPSSEEAITLSSGAFAGGVVAWNIASVLDCRNTTAVTAIADMGESYAGGIVSLNAVRAADAYGLTYYIGIVRDSLCGGAVNALSARLDACAGGIVARNNQGRVYSCGQTEAVSASTGGAKAYELIGGIVGYNYGIVDKCFFIGSLAEYEERTCVGGVCGLNRIAYNFRVNLGENYFSSGDHTCGAILFDVNNDYYRSIEAQKIYSLSALELDAENAQYIETFLDPGGTAATVEEIKAMEGIYYE